MSNQYTPHYSQRCGQPTQQQGLRIPPLSFEIPFLIRISLVSAFTPEVTQQIHSLRASGVISAHTLRAAAEAMRALRKSAGILCTVPEAIAVITQLYSSVQYEPEFYPDKDKHDNEAHYLLPARLFDVRLEIFVLVGHLFCRYF
jgi:hypothetical protein